MTRKEMKDMKTADKVLYICNQEKCEGCTASEGMCQHTSDVEYAANFVKVDDDVYMETEVARLVPAATVEPEEVYMTGEDYDLYMKGYNQARKDFERSQGEWTVIDYDKKLYMHSCSNLVFEYPYNFCPNCGAEMKSFKDCTELHKES